MKNTNDLSNEIIPLDRLTCIVNQKKDRLLDDYLSPLDIVASQFKVLCSIRCAVCIILVELKKVLPVDLGVLMRMLDKPTCKGWIERSPNPHNKRDVLAKLTGHGAATREQCHQLVRQDLHQELTKNLTADEVATFEYLLKRILSQPEKGMTMSRRSTDIITIHNILDQIENNLELPLSLEKVSERSGYSKWHLQWMFKKETGHSLGQYICSRKMTEIVQKLKESNEPILYLAERYGFEPQQTLTWTFKNYFDVPPHKYRMTDMHGESRYSLPLNQCNC